MSKATPKQFVKAWQESSSLKEVAEKLGMKPTTANSRASFYRSKGIPLKKMRGGRFVDWDELKQFARECLEEEKENSP